MLELTGFLVWTGVTLVLILLSLILLVGPVRRKVRWVLLYLGLYLALQTIAYWLPDESPSRRFLRLLGLFFIVTAVGFNTFLLLTQSRLSRAFVRPMPQIFLDIVHILIYIIALVVTLAAADISAAELFTGSALLTAIIGLSLRDTVGNLLAGLAIQAQRPFEVGDWIQFSQDQSQIGQVLEINWRATKVLTSSNIEIIVPNALLATVPIVNFSRPEKLLERLIVVHVPYDIPPMRARTILLEAVANVPGVLEDPRPTVLTTAFDDRGVQLTLSVFVTDYSKRLIDSVLRDRIWYALKRNNITIPAASRYSAPPVTEEDRIERHERGLCCVDFLRQLPEESRRQLASRALIRLYVEGEFIIKQGDNTTELYVIESGEVSVLASRDDETAIEVTRLRDGDFFGEMAALTGETRRASVQATKECTLLVLNKSALSELFERSPESAAHVSQIVTARMAGTDAKLSSRVRTSSTDLDRRSDHLLQRIKAFFSI